MSPDPDLELATLVRGRGAMLLDALDAALPGMREHADAVASYAFTAAVELGQPRGRAELIREAARLHDAGRVYGADRVAHHELGAQLARGAGVPEEACAWIGAIGERFDGGGPRGLAAERIPLESRIISAGCALDLAGGEVGGLREAAGGRLDPRVVEALAALLARVAAHPGTRS